MEAAAAAAEAAALADTDAAAAAGGGAADWLDSGASPEEDRRRFPYHRLVFVGDGQRLFVGGRGSGSR